MYPAIYLHFANLGRRAGANVELGENVERALNRQHFVYTGEENGVQVWQHRRDFEPNIDWSDIVSLAFEAECSLKIIRGERG